MAKRFFSMPFCLLLGFMLVFSACSTSTVGTVPRGTPDTGNGTPAVPPTPSPELQPTLTTASAQATGAFYTFVRKNQLWVALHNRQPAQMTHFDYTNTPDVFWHQSVWSAGDRYLAFIVNAQQMGLGGGGCPGPNYGANGALYVLNTATEQFSRVMLPAVQTNVSVQGTPQSDNWQYAFWEDATHLLAWYNGVAGKTSTLPGLYRFDLTTQTLTQVLPLSSVGMGTLFAPQPGMPILLSMHYSNEQLFYQVIVHPFEQQSQVVIYRHSLLHPEQPGAVVVHMGQEPWCATPASGPFMRPGWDVSPDGGQIVAQVFTATDSTQVVGAIQSFNLNDGSTTALFTHAPADFLNRDVTLTWGPDSQSVVATAYHLFSQAGPYSTSLANPTAMQQYAPNVSGQVAWRTDSAAFALQNVDMFDVTTAPDVYVFLTGDTQGQMLLSDARNFVWG